MAGQVTEPEALAGLRKWLADDGMIRTANATMTPLSGGVSCDVVLVRDGERAFVVKRALEKLRVKDDWFADPVRNRYEHSYMEVVGGILPGAVPRVLHANDARGYFCMEWLGEGWDTWKQQMLVGTADTVTAAEAGRVLGRIHRDTSGRADLLAEFDTKEAFHDLRLDPYLLTTGSRHPDLEPLFRAEVVRIRATRECLVHGDYSPKNLMVRGGRVVVLDCEVAWYGDPVFDLAFLLNHLHLKGLHHGSEGAVFAALPGAVVEAYMAERAMDAKDAAIFDARTARLMLMLMLARIDGKSPAEYLAGHEAKREWVRRFVRTHLPGREPTLHTVTTAWFDELNSLS